MVNRAKQAVIQGASRARRIYAASNRAQVVGSLDLSRPDTWAVRGFRKVNFSDSRADEYTRQVLAEVKRTVIPELARRTPKNTGRTSRSYVASLENRSTIIIVNTNPFSVAMRWNVSGLGENVTVKELVNHVLKERMPGILERVRQRVYGS